MRKTKGNQLETETNVEKVTQQLVLQAINASALHFFNHAP